MNASEAKQLVSDFKKRKQTMEYWKKYGRQEYFETYIAPQIKESANKGKTEIYYGIYGRSSYTGTLTSELAERIENGDRNVKPVISSITIIGPLGDISIKDVRKKDLMDSYIKRLGYTVTIQDPNLSCRNGDRIYW